MMRTIFDRLGGVLLTDMRATRWTLGWVALVLSAGLFATSTTTANYAAMNGLQDRAAWGAMFMLYGLHHVAASLYRIPAWLSYPAELFGLWLWAYLFLSFVVFDPTPVQATEIMLAVPLVSEVWILAEDIYRRKNWSLQHD